MSTRTQAAWRTVLTREIAVKVRDKTFVISTLSTMVIIAAMIVFNAFMADRTTEHDLATSGPLAAEAVEQADAAMGDKTTVTGREVQPVEAEDLVRDEEVDAALIHDGDSWSLVADTEIDSDLETAIEQAVSQVTVADNAEDHGTTIEQLSAGSALETTFLSAGEDRGLATYLLRFAFAFLFYMAALIFGMAIANSVLEEKQNRVVEILATAIPIRELLYGKVLGNCLVAFAQIGLYAAVGLLTANILDVTGEFGWALSASGWFIAFFVVGFGAQASIWAVLGSLASRSEDLQSNTTVITTVLVVAMFAGLFAQGPWLVVASYVPILSSIAMPARVLQEQAMFWEPFAALAVCLVFGWLMLRLGEKVYQRAVFQGGRALTWRQALKLED